MGDGRSGGPRLRWESCGHRAAQPMGLAAGLVTRGQAAHARGATRSTWPAPIARTSDPRRRSRCLVALLAACGRCRGQRARVDLPTRAESPGRRRHVQSPMAASPRMTSSCEPGDDAASIRPAFRRHRADPPPTITGRSTGRRRDRARAGRATGDARSAASPQERGVAARRTHRLHRRRARARCRHPSRERPEASAVPAPRRAAAGSTWRPTRDTGAARGPGPAADRPRCPGSPPPSAHGRPGAATTPIARRRPRGPRPHGHSLARPSRRPRRALRRQVFGFLPVLGARPARRRKLNYDVLSTIAYFSVGADREGQPAQAGRRRHQHHRAGAAGRSSQHDLGHQRRPPAAARAWCSRSASSRGRSAQADVQRALLGSSDGPPQPREAGRRRGARPRRRRHQPRLRAARQRATRDEFVALLKTFRSRAQQGPLRLPAHRTTPRATSGNYPLEASVGKPAPPTRSSSWATTTGPAAPTTPARSTRCPARATTSPTRSARTPRGQPDRADPRDPVVRPRLVDGVRRRALENQSGRKYGYSSRGQLREP